MLLEACLDSLELAVAAERGGAGRIELCDRLDIGGTTPPVELIKSVTRAVTIPVFVIVRPRGGDFFHTEAEVDAMRRDARIAVESGAAGIVLGILHRDRTIHRDATRSVIEMVPAVPATFHLAFDQVPDQLEALETLVGLGVERVLTSGGAGRAIDGVDRLRALVDRAGGRMAILAGGSIREDNAAEIVAKTGVSEIHSRGTNVAAIVSAARAGEATFRQTSSHSCDS